MKATNYARKLKALKLETRLEKAVRNAVLDQTAPDEVEGWLNDLMEHGCQCGMVSGLVYYDDTAAFYNRHKDDINTLLSETLESTGFKSAHDVFGNKLQESDPLFLGTHNQNLMAWFAFEETARKLACEIGIEI